MAKLRLAAGSVYNTIMPCLLLPLRAASPRRRRAHGHLPQLTHRLGTSASNSPTSKDPNYPFKYCQRYPLPAALSVVHLCSAFMYNNEHPTKAYATVTFTVLPREILTEVLKKHQVHVILQGVPRHEGLFYINIVSWLISSFIVWHFWLKVFFPD